MIRNRGRGGKRKADILYVAPSSAIFPLPLELQVETHELFWRLFCSGFFEFPLGVKWSSILRFSHFFMLSGGGGLGAAVGTAPTQQAAAERALLRALGDPFPKTA